MRPICHKCKKQPADIIENNIFWCGVCKCLDLSLPIEDNSVLTKTRRAHGKEEKRRNY